MSSTTAIIYGRGFETGNITLQNTLAFIARHKNALRDDKLIEEAFQRNAAEYKSIFSIIADTIEVIDVWEIPENVTSYNYDELISDNITVDAIHVILEQIHSIDDIYEPEDVYPAVIADIIRLETGLPVCYQHGQDECEGESSILLQEKNPWYMTDVERNLKNSDQFDMLIAPYTKELGLDPSDIDDLKIEYYG